MIGIMKMLNNISRCQAMYREKQIHAEDLCFNHYAFVLQICRCPGRSQEELARELCLDKSTVARSLAYLEKTLYITRTANALDKRQYLVYPTEKMKEVLPKVRNANAMWNERIAEGVSQEDYEIFCKVLAHMEQNAKNIRNDLEKSV